MVTVCQSYTQLKTGSSNENVQATLVLHISFIYPLEGNNPEPDLIPVQPIKDFSIDFCDFESRPQLHIFTSLNLHLVGALQYVSLFVSPIISPRHINAPMFSPPFLACFHNQVLWQRHIL